jgi:hypothetical protein
VVTSGTASRFRAIVVLVLVVLFAVAFYLALRHKRDLVDYTVYETAATRVLGHEPLYRPSDDHWQYKYLPAFAYTMTPFAKMQPEVARAVWFGLSFGLVMLFLRLSARALPDPRLTESRLVWLIALLLIKCWAKELIFGQTNVLLGVVCVYALLAAQRKRPVAAGALVGVAFFVKPYGLILVPWLALSLGVPALVSFAAVIIAGLALPIINYGWQGNIDLVAGWYHTVTETTAPNLFDPENVSFATMWAKWIGGTPTAHALALATCVAAMALVGVVFLMRRRVKQPDFLEVALLLLFVPLISPQGWDYVLVLAVPLVMCLVDRWALLPIPWRLVAGLAIFTIGFTVFDVVGRVLYAQAMKYSVISLAAVACAACGLYLRARTRA